MLSVLMNKETINKALDKVCSTRSRVIAISNYGDDYGVFDTLKAINSHNVACIEFSNLYKQYYNELSKADIKAINRIINDNNLKGLI